jgi:hypothetical protein
VERILLEMVRPDPVQPRRVLPEQLHIAFHSSRLTPVVRRRRTMVLIWRVSCTVLLIRWVLCRHSLRIGFAWLSRR